MLSSVVHTRTGLDWALATCEAQATAATTTIFPISFMGRRRCPQRFLIHKNSGAPGETRTPDPLVRSQMLYPAELRARSGHYKTDSPVRPRVAARSVTQRAASSRRVPEYQS